MAFFRLLSEAASRQMSMRESGAGAANLDERWLLRLLERIAARDEASVAALIAFRIAAPHRRLMRVASIDLLHYVGVLEGIRGR